MIITLDIETIPSSNPQIKADFLTNVRPPATHKKPETIDAWMAENAESEADQQWRKTSFDGAHGHICVLGYAFDDEPAEQYSTEHPSHEAEILKCFFGTIDLHCKLNPNVRPIFVGHNVIDFDLRFIYQRAIVLGVKPSINIPFHAKAWDEHVFDTMHRWDAKNRTSLDKLSRALGLEGKGDIDGSMVADYVAAGRIAEVAAYCLDDVNLTRQVYKRMTFHEKL